jgi:hypothetical protein
MEYITQGPNFPRTYALIDPEVWHDPRFLALSHPAQLVLLFLWTECALLHDGSIGELVADVDRSYTPDLTSYRNYKRTCDELTRGFTFRHGRYVDHNGQTCWWEQVGEQWRLLGDQVFPFLPMREEG